MNDYFVYIAEEEAEDTHEAIGKHTNAWFSGLTEFRWVLSFEDPHLIFLIADHFVISKLEANENGAFGVWEGPRVTM